MLYKKKERNLETLHQAITQLERIHFIISDNK